MGSMRYYSNQIDGLVGPNDSQIVQATTGKITLTDVQRQSADVDGTPAVSANDALLILQYATKKIVQF